MGTRELAERTVTRSDLFLTMAVHYRLFRACGFGNGLRVHTSNGAVTVSGKVSSTRQRSEAEAAVRSVRGVQELWSLVQVVAEGRDRRVGRSDAALLKRVVAAARADSRMRGIRVASVDDGVVLLTGRVRSERQKLIVVEAIRACPGVRDVASLVTVSDEPD